MKENQRGWKIIIDIMRRNRQQSCEEPVGLTETNRSQGRSCLHSWPHRCVCLRWGGDQPDRWCTDRCGFRCKSHRMRSIFCSAFYRHGKSHWGTLTHRFCRDKVKVTVKSIMLKWSAQKNANKSGCMCVCAQGRSGDCAVLWTGVKSAGKLHRPQQFCSLGVRSLSKDPLEHSTHSP